MLISLQTPLGRTQRNFGLLSRPAQEHQVYRKQLNLMGLKAYSPTSIAHLFNTFFHFVFNKRCDESSVPLYPLYTTHVINSLVWSVEDVARLLSELDVTTSSGPDSISPRILKECAYELALSLTGIFNLSLSTGQLPNDWKMANVVPIHKAGERVMAVNYRPVSLTSIVVKTLERMVHKHIMNFLSELHLLCENQHGFRRFWSCLTQLLQLVHHWFSVLDKQGAIDVAFLDFAKAFDRVSHPHLINKLKSYGVSGQLLEWLNNFLSNRKQRVMIDGHESNWLEVTSGVPQGSILGPLLFLVYINDLPSSVTSKVDLFADDSVIHRQISTSNDCVLFQENLNQVKDWCDASLVQLKNEKCRVVHVTRQRKPLNYEYNLDEMPLLSVAQHKHLGVWLQSSLSWQYHISHVCGKANRILGLIRRTFGYKNQKGVEVAFMSLVRPILEYCCQVWNPYLIKHVNAMEKIQRRATRLIYGPDQPYMERLKRLNWPSLELRRMYLCLVQLYKIMFGLCDIDKFKYLDIVGESRTRSSHRYKLRQKHACTNYFKFSFFNRYISDWNSLCSFKRKLMSFLLLKHN